MQRCVKCGNRSFKSIVVPYSVTVGEQKYLGEIAAQECTRCGEDYTEAQDMREFEQAVARELFASGPMSGPGLVYGRKMLGIQAIELAQLLDVTPNSISRWEHGRSPIDRATWTTVRDLVMERIEGTHATRDMLEALGRKRAIRKRVPVTV